MGKMRKNRKPNKLLLSLIAALVLTLAVATAAVLAAGENTGAPVNITYSSGSYTPNGNAYGVTEPTNLFDSVNTTANKTASGTLILPGTEFSDNITDLTLGERTSLDSETFYMEVPGEGQTNADLWAYTFTGWKIAGATEKIPGETVFQPGDVLTDDLLAKYAPDGNLNLEAVWGKCYFIRNPYKTMVYSNTLVIDDKTLWTLDDAASAVIEDNSTGASDLNAGNNPSAPKATVVGLYTDFRSILSGNNNPDNHTAINANPAAYDAYATVVMLTGDLDYLSDSNKAPRVQSIYYGYDATKVYNSNIIGYVSATYKSLGDGSTYNYLYKPAGYYNNPYANFRFDNINFVTLNKNSENSLTVKRTEDGVVTNVANFYDNYDAEKNQYTYQSYGNEFELFANSSHTAGRVTYFETTARFDRTLSSTLTKTSAISTLRTGQRDYVVLNGGTFNSLQNNYNATVKDRRLLHWTVGRNVKFSGSIHCGTTTNYERDVQWVNNRYDLKVLGGTVGNVYGGMNGMYTHCFGDRNIRIIGNGDDTSTEYNPKITNVYGGGEYSRLYGDVSITIDNCTKLTNVYGGGKEFTATVYGDITINVNNSTISGNFYGGGYNANCEKAGETYKYYTYTAAEGIKVSEKKLVDLLTDLDKQEDEDRTGKGGNVTLNIKNSKLKKGLYGSGMGSSTSVTTVDSSGVSGDKWYKDNQDLQYYPEGWDEALDDYPSYDYNTNSVYVRGYKEISWGNTASQNITFRISRMRVSLSVATVQNVNINIDDESVINGNIYGGGAIAKVLGNTSIKINNSRVEGNVFGGGEGDAAFPTAKVYDQISGNYTAPSYEITQFNNNGNPSKVTLNKQTPSSDAMTYKNYTWTSDISVLENYGGIDTERKLLYTPNATGFGTVDGNCEVSINNSTVTKTIYGGGNLGDVDGSTTVTINGGSIDTVYGGANQADIGGYVELYINGGNIKNVYGGNNASGSIFGDQLYVQVEGGTIETLFGGGNEADYSGGIFTLIDGGKITGTAYGGANKADIGGETLIAVDSGEVATLYGANNESGEIFGDVYVELCGGKVGTLFGGGNRAAYTGNLNTSIEGGVADYVYGGANEAKLTGDVFIEFTGGNILYELYGGSNKADITGDVNLTIDGGTVGSATISDGKIISVTGDVYGGNNSSGTISGKINTTLESGTVNQHLFGGGNMADYPGETNLVINGGNVGYLDTPQVVADKSVQSCAFGGGNKAVVGGTKVTVNGGTLRALVGGSLSADISGEGADEYGASITVYITGATPTAITTFMAGNDQSGFITGNVRVVIGIEENNMLIPGTGEINYTEANPNSNIRITNAFGGGNSADYTYGNDWVIPEVNPGRESPIEGYMGITVTVLAGEIYQLFGGGVMADVSNVRTAIYGGEYHFIYGGGFMGYTRTTVTNLRGGNISGEFLVFGDAALPTAQQGGYVFGGGYNGYTSISIVNVEQLQDRMIHVDHSVFAGGNGQSAGTGYSKITMINGTVAGSVYGGGYSAAAGVNPDGNIPLSVTDQNGKTVYAVKDKYDAYIIDVAGNYRDACAVVELSGGNIGMEHASDPERPYIGNVYGGGYKGITTETHVDIMSYIRGDDIKLYLGGNVYGGGHEGDVIGNTHIHYFKGEITGNVYGGGREGNVYGGGTYIYMLAGVLHGNLYGGGLNGTAENTHIIISDKLSEVIDYLNDPDVLEVIESLGLTTSDLVTTIGGSVYGGGEGEDASVYGTTFVRINLKHVIGDTAVQADGVNGQDETSSYIEGSVYGGGDLGGVGTELTPGKTEVTIQDGLIFGDVFGGGNGEPSDGSTRKDEMGVVFGTALVNIFGGEIKRSVYGGGNRGNVDETHIDIMAYYDSDTQSAVLILGSVYGGGKNGNVEENTHIHLFEGEIAGSVFGGGENGYIFGETYVYMLAGEVYGSLYGGGYNGTADKTNVIISDKIEEAEATGAEEILDAISKLSLVTQDLKTVIHGSVYGGGEGTAATVYTSTNIKINLENLMADSGNPTSDNTEPKAIVSWIEGNVFGGGNLGAVGTRNYPYAQTAVVIKDGWIKGAVYAGGNGVPPTGQLYRDGMGEVYGKTHLDLYGGAVDGSVFGGGLRGSVLETHIDIMAYYNHTIQDILIISGSVYAGGEDGDVKGDTKIHYFIGEVKGSLYGGGYNGDVIGTAYVYMFAGHLYGNLYGGGENGRVNKTKVTLIDDIARIEQENVPEINETIAELELSDEDVYITVDGDVFGGGKGASADVLTSTEVIINLNYSFDVTETPTTTKDEVGSGEIKTTVIPTDTDNDGTPDDRGFIGGSVYGGGDLGQVGQGNINASTNTATIKVAGSTSVTVRSGHIKGSVFGGGSGVPPATLVYSHSMGAVLGKTDVLIEGGYIEGNIYGGGTQSRVYAELGDDKYASSVKIIETIRETDGIKTYKKIAIGGSVFGGGDRGSGKLVNASVPTTIGNVTVEITGLSENARNPKNSTSNIYFVGLRKNEGGVYGDGNYCLVNGERIIRITNLNTGAPIVNGAISLKTFYSLQRADKVYLNNSAVVLLGALDLVDEVDKNIYSINRVSSIYMQNGSTFKLDGLAKYLSALYSDYETDKTFIDNGNNGGNGYTVDGGEYPADRLTDEYIEAYRESDTIRKNTVCVANGLYLEIMDADGKYGPVVGLFTLELLKAIPGEGGGFVYANIKTSTGDFICQTKRGYTYNAITVDGGMTKEQFDADKEDGKVYYYRVVGEGYYIAEEYTPNILYYTRTETDGYMDVTDDVGGYDGNVYTCYFWYIKGPTITYTGTVTGYIGSEDTRFATDKVIPQHTENLYYILFGMTVNDTLEKAISDGKYVLVQSAENISGQEIAIELTRGTDSLGFLYYDSVLERWGLKISGQEVYGYQGITGNEQNNILNQLVVDNDTSRLSFVMHKSTEVNAELNDMNVIIEIDLVDEMYEPYTGGTSTLIFDITIEVVRMVPVQTLFTETNKGFAGVFTQQIIKITGQSAFTAEYQTRYIPSAFPKQGEYNMSWILSTYAYRYFMNETYGQYITVNEQGDIVNISSSYTDAGLVTEVGEAALGPGNIYRKGDKYYARFADPEDKTKTLTVELTEVEDLRVNSSMIPKATKIIMIDLTANTPTYYYYITSETVREINILDFCEMGTTKKIRDMSLEEKPSFMYQYEVKTTSRITERLIFVVDFSNTTWSSDFTGEIGLKHLYGTEGKETDIMDYVKLKTETDDEEKPYERFAPESTVYEVKLEVTGLVGWEAKFEKEEYLDKTNEDYYDKDVAKLIVSFDINNEWINTKLNEGDFSLKIELLDETNAKLGDEGRPVSFPVGMVFIYENEFYHPGVGRRYAVIPLKNVGTHEIEIENLLYSLKDIVNTEDDGEIKATFRVTLYSSPDAEYYDSLSTNLIQSDYYKIKDNPSYSISASTEENAIYNSGDDVNIALSIDREGAEIRETKVQVVLMQKSAETGEYTTVNWNHIFHGQEIEEIMAQTQTLKWTLKDNAESGTYRLEFSYGNKTEYLYIIVG